MLVVDGLLNNLQAVDENGEIRAVYHTTEEESLYMPSIVAVAVDPESDDIYLTSKVENAVYRLSISPPSLLSR